MAIESGYSSDYLNRGIAKYGTNAYFEAIEDFDRAINPVSNYGDAYKWRADAKLKLGQHTDAIADYSVAIRLSTIVKSKNICTLLVR